MSNHATEEEHRQIKPLETAIEDDEDRAATAKRSKKGQSPRKRVSQACDKCRSRKDKCDGKKPACSACVSNRRTCSYGTNVKKRGLPEGYVRGMEKLWGLAIQSADDAEETILDALNNEKEASGSPLTIWNDEANSEKLVQVWRDSHLSKELERLLSCLEPIGESSKRKRVDLGFKPTKRVGIGRGAEVKSAAQPAKEMRASVSIAGEADKTLDTDSPSELADFPGVGVAVESVEYAATGLASKLTPIEGIGKTQVPSSDIQELPSETWHLMDIYFSYSHSWFPIIEKNDILRTYYQYSQRRRSQSPSGDEAALWALIAYAKFQNQAIKGIARAQIPAQNMVWTAEKLYTHARSLIPNEEGTWQLGHIQALLILTLSNMGMGHFDRAWILVGQAVRATIHLDIGNLQPADLSLASSQTKSRAKHVFLGCFALDTLIAARLGRCPHLRNDDINSVGFIEEDGLDEWDPWNDCLSLCKEKHGSTKAPAFILSTFNQFIQVLKLLNEAICLPKTSNSLYLNNGLLKRLHAWGQGQAALLSSDSSTETPEQATFASPHQFHLQATYLATLTTSQLLNYNLDHGKADLEQCASTAGQTSELIRRHSDKFGMLILPPTYEYFTRRAYDVLNEVQSSIENTHILVNEWRRKLDIQLGAMEPAWPAFGLLKNLAANQLRPNDRLESDVAFDLITGANQTQNTPTSARTPQTTASFENTDPYGFYHIYPERMTHPLGSAGHSTMATPARVLRRSKSLARGTGPGLPSPPSNYQDSRSVLGRRDTNPFQVATVKTTANLSKLDYASMDTLSSLGTTIPANTSAVAENDADSLFSEFAALDAMEWTNNWDQSLLNLGFTDRDNMNQDFYAFCQEPDPFHPNHVFQQLIENSNTERTDFFDGPGSSGADVGDESEGIEASQILQSLSMTKGPQTLGS